MTSLAVKPIDDVISRTLWLCIWQGNLTFIYFKGHFNQKISDLEFPVPGVPSPVSGHFRCA